MDIITYPAVEDVNKSHECTSEYATAQNRSKRSNVKFMDVFLYLFIHYVLIYYFIHACIYTYFLFIYSFVYSVIYI